MPSTCNRDDCNGAVSLVDDNGATDPSQDRWEQYECEYGHTFSIVLEGRK
jgi:hypothetical protein